MAARRAIGSEVGISVEELDREQFPIQDTSEIATFNESNPQLSELREIKALFEEWRAKNQEVDDKYRCYENTELIRIKVDEVLEDAAEEETESVRNAWLRRECCRAHREVMEARKELIKRAKRLTGDIRKNPTNGQEMVLNEDGSTTLITDPAMFSEEWYKKWEKEFSG